MDIKSLIEDEKLVKCLDNIKAFSDDVWKDNLLPWFTTHNTSHSEEVIHILGMLVNQIGDKEPLNEHEVFILIASAYLHDIGMQYLKADDKTIEKLTESDYESIRMQHAQKSYDIILGRIAPTIESKGFQLPNIHEQYISHIAKVARGHSGRYYKETIEDFQKNPATPFSRKARCELLTALLLIADELDLQSKRVDFNETAKFDLSTYAQMHWFKHHYIDYIEVIDNTVNISLMFPENAEEYSELVKNIIVRKLNEQITLVNPILRKYSHGSIHLASEPIITTRTDDTGVKRPLPNKVFEELKRQTKDIRDKKVEILEKEVNVPIRVIKEEYRSDVPPSNQKWVGRSKELNLLSSDEFKVVFITGIGGQGKSGLASYYIKNVIEENDDWEYWDWRDYKEEDHRVHTQIVLIIERLTNGEINAAQLREEPIESLVEAFFVHLGKRKIVFVFDNLDRYVDFVKATPSGGIDKIVDMALKYDHSSKFIFTCRPVIRNASVGFCHIPLEGLSLEDARNLFNSYAIPLKKEVIDDLAKNAHELTRGHPLWLNLIAAQAVRGKENVTKFIEGIKNVSNFNEDDFSSLLSEKVLSTVWDTLNANQRTLLRGMSEIVRAETEENLMEILRGVLSANRFNKALRALKSLSLIVVKSSPSEKDLLELHPLVKGFQRNKYTQSEREKYITLFVNYYNQLIFILKPNICCQSPLSHFERWTDKIELEVNNCDYNSALNTLDDVGNLLLTAGYIEEYVRVANLIYSDIDWIKSINEGTKHFHNNLDDFIKALIEFGKNEKVETYLNKYEKSLPAKDENYINYCNLKCYCYWFVGQHEEAISWGEKQLEIMRSPGANAQVETPHYLALAWRDTRKAENIDKALKYFLHGSNIVDVLSKDINEDHGGEYYGNIGRCLWFQGESDDALKCYKKSLVLLYRGEHKATILNKGYACLWIAEVLKHIGDTKNAYYFLKNTFFFWNRVSPPKASKVMDEMTELIKSDALLDEINNISEDEMERYCKSWVEN